TATTTMPIALSALGGAVEVSNSATILTLTGTIGASGGSVLGPLIKTGPGVLILNNPANSYAGGITVSAGRLDVSSDAMLGLANPTVNPAGTLRYTANSTTARTFNLNAGTLEAPHGVTLILNGATVNGGFLRGTGVFALSGNTSISGASTLASTTINQVGPATLTNFTNSGTFTS